MTIPRSRLVAILGLVFLAAVVASWWATAQIKGEVFVVNDSGRPIVVPGAFIVLFKSSESQERQFAKESGQLFLRNMNEKLENQRTNQGWESDEPKRVGLDIDNDFADVKYCQELSKLQAGVYNKGTYISASGDREGRFVLDVMPGTYLMSVSGQAGQRHVQWYESVTVIWRKELRLVNPICSFGPVAE
jgi:hypothetical protein